MKKVKILVATLAFVVLGQTVSNAIQSGNLPAQKEVNKNTVKQVQLEKSAAVSEAIEKVGMLTDRYYKNLRTCEPVHVHYSMDIFGLKFGFKIDINGWNNDNKCEYRMAVNLDSLGKDIREVYDVKVTDEQLEKIKPVLECNFTKEQLNLMVDAIVARNQLKEEQLKEMLANPNEKYVNNKKYSKMTPEEEKLVAVLMTGNVCTVPNKEELMNQITEVMHSIQPKKECPKTAPQGDNDSVIQKPQAPQY